jgi:hypothetical protein
MFTKIIQMVKKIMQLKFIGNAGGIFTGSNGTRILYKKAHRNNTEIGTHINFKRVPNKMDPDIHTCMSFFHL